jgi:hypothetical protein
MGILVHRGEDETEIRAGDAASDMIWPSRRALGSDGNIDLNLKRNGVTPFELALANAECAAIKRK